MPYSYEYFKEEVREWLIENLPTDKKVLDVGPGLGTYSKLLDGLGYTIDAVEIYEPYIEKYELDKKYNKVYLGDIVNFDISKYDFLILGDVLEHIKVDPAKDLINRILESNKSCLVAVPYMMEQGDYEGNMFETHHQPDLTPKVMEERYPKLVCIYNNEYYGYYVDKNI
jgi:hypothetical protein